MSRKKQYFIGRKHELELLDGLSNKKSSSLVVIRGRRRIGKSRLVERFADGVRFLRFSGLPEHAAMSEQEQRDEFYWQLTEMLKLDKNERYDDWGQLFRLLARQVKVGKVVILFDEISWMGSKDHLFLPQLKTVWDMEFKKNPELIMILCGSVSSWIEKNILRSTGFFGRFSLILDVKELSIIECNQFFLKIGFNGAPYEKFKLLSVTGGIPRYLEEIQGNLTAEENINNLCFKESGILVKEFDFIFSDIFSKRAVKYRKIIEALSSGKKDITQISAYLDISANGHVSEYLDDLLLSGFIKRVNTWNITTCKISKLRQYRLSDNYLRFYLKYIEPNIAKIERGDFLDKSITNLPGFLSIMGFQFENLVLNNRKFILEVLKIYPEDIVNDGAYFQTSTNKQQGCQIDYMIQLKTGVLFVCEIKFHQNEIKKDIIKEVKQKIEALSVPRGYSVKPILIHVNGVSEYLVDENYFYKIVDFSKLLE